MRINQLIKLQYVAIASLILCVVAITPAHAQSAGCLTLTAEQSEDKNYYKITATASDGAITGYEFNFGDKQSYTFDIQNAPGKDKKIAVVRHTYEKSGIYNVSARVINTTDNGEVQNSASCTTQIINGQVPTLPVTGPSNDDTQFIVTLLVVGVAVYGFVFIIRTPR